MNLQGERDIPDWGEGQPAAAHLPYCQIVNPPNLSLKKIEADGSPWGLFIPQDQAQSAGFSSNNSPWQYSEIEFVEDKTTPGLLATDLIMLVLAISPLEVEVKSGQFWKYAGLSFLSNGERSPLSVAASQEKSLDFEQRQYRERSRMLVMFLDRDKKLLHQIPFQLSLKGAVGASIVTEVKAFRSAVETEYFSLKGLSRRKLPDAALANAKLNLKLGLNKPGSKSPFVCPIARNHPSRKTGTETIKAFGDRTIDLVYAPIADILLDNKSETSKSVLIALEDNKGFTKRTVGEAQPEEDSPTADNSEMLRSQIANLKNELDWSIDRLNSFIQSIFAGKTLANLTEDELLLVAQEMTTQANILFEEPPY